MRAVHVAPNHSVLLPAFQSPLLWAGLRGYAVSDLPMDARNHEHSCGIRSRIAGHRVYAQVSSSDRDVVPIHSLNILHTYLLFLNIIEHIKIQ